MPDHARMARIVATIKSFGWALAPEKLCIGLPGAPDFLGAGFASLACRSLLVGVM